MLLALCSAGATAAARECTAADWVHQYTECRVSTNTRDLLYFKNPATDECEGGVPCPANVYGLRCDIACGAGHYLEPGTTQCAACSKGTYAIGGGDRATNFSRFPIAGAADTFSFTTYLLDEAGTKHTDTGIWEVADGGLALRSGRIAHSQSSVLVLPLRVCCSFSHFWKNSLHFRAFALLPCAVCVPMTCRGAVKETNKNVSRGTALDSL